MSDRVRTSVLFSVLVLLAACGGGDGASTSKCPEGMSGPQNCAGKTDPACPGSPLVAMCMGGQWSQCTCSGSTGTMSGGQTMTGAPGTPPAGTMTCGNNKAEGDELCDGTDLKGMTCAGVTGMASASGMLKCNDRCTFDMLLCLSGNAAAPSGGTGAGGTGARTMGAAAGSGGSGR